jgi:hypothetical protein
MLSIGRLTGSNIGISTPFSPNAFIAGNTSRWEDLKSEVRANALIPSFIRILLPDRVHLAQSQDSVYISDSSFEEKSGLTEPAMRCIRDSITTTGLINFSRTALDR